MEIDSNLGCSTADGEGVLIDRDGNWGAANGLLTQWWWVPEFEKPRFMAKVETFNPQVPE
jgi:hypothetical protein